MIGTYELPNHGSLTRFIVPGAFLSVECTLIQSISLLHNTCTTICHQWAYVGLLVIIVVSQVHSWARTLITFLP